MKIRILSKRDCHLCEDAKAIVERFSKRYPLEIEVIDIEQNPELYAQYRYDIPVIFLEDRKIFKYRIDEGKFEEILSKEILKPKH